MKREPYVKPTVMQLHYSTEPDVTIAQACKTTGSSTGPATSSCRREVGPGQCVAPGT
jgi:hypothetical protein